MSDDDERSKWTKVVADLEAADLSQREFAKERGVPLSNLRYWLYKLRRESRPLVTGPAEQVGGVAEHAAPNGGSRLLPVRVVASAAPKARPGDAALLELALPSGAVLRFPVGADLEYLRQVGGFVLYYKRLERGRFRLPHMESERAGVRARRDAAVDAARRDRVQPGPPAQGLGAGGAWRKDRHAPRIMI